MSKILLSIINFYRRGISPHSLPRCRYSPTCSAFAHEAIQTHGALLGGFLAVLRIFRCNPFSRGGYDPVPPKHFYKLKMW